MPTHSSFEEHRPLHVNILDRGNESRIPAVIFFSMNRNCLMLEEFDAVKHFCITRCCTGRVQTVKALRIGAAVVVYWTKKWYKT